MLPYTMDMPEGSALWVWCADPWQEIGYRDPFIFINAFLCHIVYGLH